MVFDQESIGFLYDLYWMCLGIVFESLRLLTIIRQRIRFGKSALKCVDCLGTCHIECKTAMPTPCVPTVRTPSHFVGSIADYSPQTCPMVPALMVYCLDEIDLRGMNEAGIYRMCAPEKDIHQLKVTRHLRWPLVPHILAFFPNSLQYLIVLGFTDTQVLLWFSWGSFFFLSMILWAYIGTRININSIETLWNSQRLPQGFKYFRDHLKTLCWFFMLQRT